MRTKYTVTSSKIKSALVSHLRFERQISCVSEYSPASLRDKEDVASLYENNDGIIQLDVYEVKISYSDFKNDFKKQKHKRSIKMPYSRFIYVVSPHLAEKCSQYLMAHYPDYGLITFDYNETSKQIIGFRTIIRAKSDNKVISSDDVRFFNLRLSSMASQCLEKEEHIELLQEQLNIYKQDAKQQYRKYCRDSENWELYILKRKFSEVLNAVLSFEEVLNGSTDLPHRYKELLRQEKLNLQEIRGIYEYCKSDRDFKKMEDELNGETEK